MTTRRVWSHDQKRAIVAEIAETRGSVSIVARRHGINTGQLFRWRRDIGAAACRSPQPVAFTPVLLAAPKIAAANAVELSPAASSSSRIEIVLVGGRVVRVDADVDPGKLSAIIAALEAKT